MGFIAEGNTLTWKDAEIHLDYIKKHGIVQLLHIYENNKDRMNDDFKWGDEVEYILLNKSENGQYTLKLRAHEILDQLIKEEKENPDGVEYLWRPEYGRFMVEGTPGKPYIGLGRQLLSIEASLMERRNNVKRFLKEGESIVTLVNYPRLGCKDETTPKTEVKGPVAESQFISDQVINPHFRFSTLTANIRLRRGKNVSINIPMFRDINTNPYVDSATYKPEVDIVSTPAYNIYMDAMGFGMGCCCLQTTFQLSNIEEARTVYDHMAVFAPIMLALTASSSIFKGYLSDIDARWTVISQSVDDRTSEELGESELKTKKRVINKSRYDSIDSFLSRSCSFRPEYNDLDLIYDEETYQQLTDNGIDSQLAKHFAHLFIRDPLVIYSDKIQIDDSKHSDHFENIQSTNWQTVRFKPPPPNSNMGWRVEFRPMEVQLTDFENAAYIVFTSLLIKAISDCKLNFYVPITKVDQNMKTAHFRDAVNQNKFYFRKNVTADLSDLPVDQEYELMSIDEIFNGKKNSDFIGIINIVRNYVNKHYSQDLEVLNQINNYLSFISKRASGELMTMSKWTREFVTSHPAYQKDSIVSQEIQNDYLKRCDDILTKSVKEPQLLGDFY